MTRLLLSALLVSAAAVNGAAVAQWKRPQPKVEGCATPSQLAAAEAFNRGHGLRASRLLPVEDSRWFSSQVGMAFPGTDTVVVFSYSDGSLGIASLVDAPECWRLQILERRK